MILMKGLPVATYAIIMMEKPGQVHSSIEVSHVTKKGNTRTLSTTWLFSNLMGPTDSTHTYAGGGALLPNHRNEMGGTNKAKPQSS